jgi:hypothetical protein
MEFAKDNRTRDRIARALAGSKRIAGKPKNGRSKNKYDPPGLPTREDLIVLIYDSRNGPASSSKRAQK